MGVIPAQVNSNKVTFACDLNDFSTCCFQVVLVGALYIFTTRLNIVWFSHSVHPTNTNPNPRIYCIKFADITIQINSWGRRLEKHRPLQLQYNPV